MPMPSDTLTTFLRRPLTVRGRQIPGRLFLAPLSKLGNTAFRELILLPAGGMLIDNPGMREIQLWGDADALKDAFHDVEELAETCRFRTCRHESEPGCAVQEALEGGSLDPKRYRSYLKLQKELEHLERRRDQRARQNAKSRWKQITKRVRAMKKDGML